MMNTLIKMSAILAFISPIVSHSADIPTVVISDEEYSKEECVQNNFNDCLDAVCTTSSDTDCSQNCKAEAENKCQAVEDGD